VGRTARAELTGEAYTFVAPEEADDLRAIERAIGKPLPRVTLPDFDYSARAEPAAARPPGGGRSHHGPQGHHGSRGPRGPHDPRAPRSRRPWPDRDRRRSS
jgi:superfamily II DNA/RNA helicase